MRREIIELAKLCSVSAGTVYRLARLLGRLPTEHEINGRNKKPGPKTKYN